MRYVKYAHVASTVVAVAACAVFALVLLPDVTGLLRAESDLHRFKCSLVSRNDKARDARRVRDESLPIMSGRLDSFVTQVAGWAKEREITIQSVSPEGSPMTVDAKVGEKAAGRWNASKVVVQGRGQFEQVIGFLHKFTSTRMPVQMQSFAISSLDDGKTGAVSFQLTFTLYEESKPG